MAAESAKSSKISKQNRFRLRPPKVASIADSGEGLKNDSDSDGASTKDTADARS